MVLDKLSGRPHRLSISGFLVPLSEKVLLPRRSGAVVPPGPHVAWATGAAALFPVANKCGQHLGLAIRFYPGWEAFHRNAQLIKGNRPAVEALFTNTWAYYRGDTGLTRTLRSNPETGAPSRVPT